MESRTSSHERRSLQVKLVYSGMPGDATGPVVRPGRGILTFIMEVFGVGRFGGFGRTGRFHQMFSGS
jgi:hypothetical protein